MDIQTKDGILLRGIPDGTPDEVIKARIQKIRAEGQQTQQATPPTSAPENQPDSALTRFGRGVLQTTALPAAQLMSRPMGALGEAIGSDYLKNKPQEIDQFASELRQDAEKGAPDGFDWASVGGQIAGTLPAGALKLGQMVRNAPLVNRVLQGGVMGGQLTPTTENDAATDVGVGAGISAALPPVVRAAARVVSPTLSPAVQKLKNSGVGLTIGQTLGGAFQATEDKLRSLPIVGDLITSAQKKGQAQLNTAGYKRALEPIGEKPNGKIGHEGIKDVHDKLSKAYDSLLPNLTFAPDPVFNQNTAVVKQMVDTLRPEYASLYDNVIKRVEARMSPQGNMSGETFKNVEETLGTEIKALRRDGGYEKGKIADALNEYLTEMREGLGRVNPAFQEGLAAINKGWANYAVLRRAASGTQAQATGEFTPAQLAQAVSANAKRGNRASGLGQLSENRALMQDLSSAGQQVLTSKYPDSGTVGRGLVNLAATGGLAMNPKAILAAALMSMPYLPGTKQIINGAMFSRPKGAQALAEALRNNSGRIGTAASPLGLQMSQALMNGGPQGP